MTATLTARAAPEYGAGYRFVEVECEHGTTTSVYRSAQGGVHVADAEVVLVMLQRHHLTERCTCTMALRRRYGVQV